MSNPDLQKRGAVAFRHISITGGVDSAHCASLIQNLLLDY